MRFKDLIPNQRAKARECNTADELIVLAEAEGIDLSDEQADMIAGGD